MWGTRSTRGELLGIVQGNGADEPLRVKEISSLDLGVRSADEVLLLWRHRPRRATDLPLAIIVGEGHIRDFLAWAMTYLQRVRPFTAFCRVADAATASAALVRNEPPSLGEYEEACLGLIIGEAATYIADRLDGSPITPTLCATTYSYAMTRALALGMLSSESDPITDTWERALEIIGQAEVSVEHEGLKLPWDVLLILEKGGFMLSSSDIPRPPEAVVEACRQIRCSGEIAAEHWSRSSLGVPDLPHVLQDMRGPREQRVVAFERAANKLVSRTGATSAEASFVCGYLATRIEPGTFSHARLLAPYISHLPSALMWYGLCAGLYSQSNLRDFSAGVARRVLREILREERFLDRPKCDIAALELEAMMVDKRPSLSFLSADQSKIEVEIAPGVVTVVSRQEQEEPRDVSREVASVDAKTLLPKLTKALNELLRIKDVLSGHVKQESSGGSKASGSGGRRRKKKRS